MPSSEIVKDTQNQIFIVGANTIQNTLLAFALSEETKIPCFAVEEWAQVWEHCKRMPGVTHLVLYDCRGNEVEACLHEMDPEFCNRNVLVCLFNLSKCSGMEEKALMRYWIQGFFYIELSGVNYFFL